MSNLRNVVYLTEAQLEELRTNGTVTVNGTTIEYSDSDLYVTPLDDFDGVYAKASDFQVVSESVTTLQNTVNGHTSSISLLNTSVTTFGESIVELQETITTIRETQDQHTEEIEELQSMQGLVVQGKAQHNGDREIYIYIPRNIRERLSSPWAAKITFVSLGDDITTLIQTISGEVDDSGEYKLIGTYGQDDGSEERCCRVYDDDFISINLNNISGVNVYEGYYYFYKIEFIC